MGALCVRTFSATTTAQYERQKLLESLTQLRDLKSNLELRCGRIEVNIEDRKRAMLNIGYRRNQRSNAVQQRPNFTDSERSNFRLEATKCRLWTQRLDSFHGLLLNIERQIIVMEDAELYRESMYALRAGVTAGSKYQRAMEGLDELLADMSYQDEQCADAQQAMQAHADEPIDDDEILAELECLSGQMDLPVAEPQAQCLVTPDYRGVTINRHKQPMMLI